VLEKAVAELSMAAYSLVLEEQLIIFRNGNQEKDGGNVFEAVNPLLSLRSLPTNIEHSVGEVLDDESCFGNTGSFDARSQDILIVGEIIVGGNSVDGVEIADQG
jgi:hypothetical protein